MNILTFLQEIGLGLIDLIYPRTCAACIRASPVRGGIFCVECLGSLSFSDSHLFLENDFTDTFIGRVPLTFGSAMLYLIPKGLTENVIREIKYCDRKEFAEDIGSWYGKKLLESAVFPDFDVIIPVPLHPKKRLKRGYNQSAYFGKGLASALDVPMKQKLLSRVVHTETQTKKTRLQRLDNMHDAFRIKYPYRVAGKCILLIDDVLTTGATLEACATQLLKAGAKSVGMAAIAMGRI